ncbi:hypothetical protein FKM82_020768 [Ascaphus truei]
MRGKRHLVWFCNYCVSKNESRKQPRPLNYQTRLAKRYRPLWISPGYGCGIPVTHTGYVAEQMMGESCSSYACSLGTLYFRLDFGKVVFSGPVHPEFFMENELLRKHFDFFPL